MKKKIGSGLIIIFLSLGFFAASSTRPVFAFDTKLKVEPDTFHFWSDVDPVGT